MPTETEEENNSQKARVIIPPPEIKSVVEKTAAYVAKNGSSFEQMIIKVEQNNPKFNFLKYIDDPYRPYYLQKLNEISGKGQEEPVKDEQQQQLKTNDGEMQQENEKDSNNQEQVVSETAIDQQIKQQKTAEAELQEKQKIIEAAFHRENQFQKELHKMIFGDFEDGKQQPKQPPPDIFNISHPVLTNIDMDIIKLTAQFVARNGQKFLQGLTERERSNPQFDFLKPTHGLFNYFTQLVDSYSKVLIPQHDWLQKLEKYSQSKNDILRKAGERHLWEKMKYEEHRLKEENGFDENKGEGGMMMEIDTIDWHDFVVVEKIDLYDDEEMKDEETKEGKEEEENSQKENEAKQEQIRKQIEEIQNFQSMPPLPGKKTQQESDKQQNQVGNGASASVVNNALDPNMKIVTDYKRKAGGVEDKKKTGTQKCPKCQQEIPINEWTQHMKLELMDPKWRDNKLKLQERQNLNSLAKGDEIAQNVRRFVEQRSGKTVGESQISSQEIAANSVSVGSNSSSQQKIIWDGQSQNITRTTANIAMLAHQKQKHLQEAFQQRGELDQKSMDQLQQNLQLPQTVKNIQNQIVQQKIQQQSKNVGGKSGYEEDEDESLKILVQTLRSEGDWLRLYPGKINIQVRAPQDASDYGIKEGQVFHLNLESKITIGQVKERLSMFLNGIAPSMFRLKGSQNLPLKDQLSLAFFNVPDGAVLDMAFKSKKR